MHPPEVGTHIAQHKFRRIKSCESLTDLASRLPELCEDSCGSEPYNARHVSYNDRGKYHKLESQ